MSETQEETLDPFDREAQNFLVGWVMRQVDNRETAVNCARRVKTLAMVADSMAEAFIRAARKMDEGETKQ